ncbi:unnamed protein product, partial [Ectocarpus sp. 12 AP-2014]
PERGFIIRQEIQRPSMWREGYPGLFDTSLKEGNGGQHYLLPLQHPSSSLCPISSSVSPCTYNHFHLVLLWIWLLWRQWISSSPSLEVTRSRPVRALSPACPESSPATHST